MRFHFLYNYVQLKRTQKFILDSLKGFLCVSYKLQLTILVPKTFWAEVDLERFIKDV
jgi:hypothetical protein